MVNLRVLWLKVLFYLLTDMLGTQKDLYFVAVTQEKFKVL
jgi:hypothetical protein